MERTAIIIRPGPDGKRSIAVDEEAMDEVLKYIGQDQRHKDKFIYIIGIILNGLKNRELYDKEDIDETCKDVTAMKFFKGQENDRIYCKEIRKGDKTLVVVMGILHLRKKSTENTKKENSLIRKVAAYTYPDNRIHEHRQKKKG